MSLSVHRAEWFNEDFKRQFRWYADVASETIAERYLAAVATTLKLLTQQPGLGRLRRFRHPKLGGLRSFRIQPPFHKHLIFYRCDADTLYAERVMHGARDLPQRLAEPPVEK